MKLENAFTVAAEPDVVWRTLLDMEGVAGCLPGATIEPGDEEGTYNGTMRMKIGPMSVSYRGTATFAEVDDEARRAVISLRAREAKGQGTAMATITNRVEAADGGTRVTAETDLHVTGPQARFGRGVMEDVASRVLDEFSQCLERKLAGPAEEEAGAPPPQEERQDTFDVGAALSQTGAGRAARIAVPAALLVLAVLIVLRRRR